MAVFRPVDALSDEGSEPAPKRQYAKAKSKSKAKPKSGPAKPKGGDESAVKAKGKAKSPAKPKESAVKAKGKAKSSPAKPKELVGPEEWAGQAGPMLRICFFAPTVVAFTNACCFVGLEAPRCC